MLRIEKRVGRIIGKRGMRLVRVVQFETECG